MNRADSGDVDADTDDGNGRRSVLDVEAAAAAKAVESKAVRWARLFD